MVCLLCHQEIPYQIGFLDIFLLRSESNKSCQECKNQFQRITGKHCLRCFRAHQDSVCQDCLMWEKKGELVAHEALYVYDKQMKEYFSRFKFQGDYHLAAVFSRELKQVLKKYKGYTIVPVPVSEERYQERGFNQVTALLEFAGLPYQNLVLKKDSKKQSSKTKQERLASHQIFRLRKHQALPSKILIVDDIYTTGSTIALMKTLFTEKNVKKIKSFSLSR